MEGAYREVRLGPLDVELEHRSDGSMIVRSCVSVPPHPDKLTTLLEHWAARAPDRTFLAKRQDGGDWRHISYAEALAGVRRIATALLSRGLSPDRPIAILSENDIEHALLALAAMYIGVPFAPVSPAYSLLSSDFGKLRHILTLLEPQLVFTADAGRYERAITACCAPDVEIVATQGEAAGRRITTLASLLETRVAPIVDVAHEYVGLDTIAKVLFTSGSTGVPKGVVTTQRMLVANQAMIRHWLAFLADEPPVLLDWLPWNHTFGGSHNFGLVLYSGGTLYIDEGRPTPQGFAQSLRNLREIVPTIYFNVPKGYEELVSALRRDRALTQRFFEGVKLTFYAAAALPRHLSDALDTLAVSAIGRRVPMVNGFGATETAPAALASTLDTLEAGNIGVPLPGVSIKLVPSGGKLEARVASASLLPGYWKDPENSARAFDEEGYYRLGDALRFAEPGNAAGGFFFDGRLTEDFKLTTGTWVSVGPLRARAIATFAPLARDIVVTGHDRGEVCALVFPDMDSCRELLPLAGRGRRDAEILTSMPVVSAFRERLTAMVRQASGSSTRIMRILLLDEPPSIDANEITDKGSINQRAVLARRAASVEALYAPEPSPRVLFAHPDFSA